MRVLFRSGICALSVIGMLSLLQACNQGQVKKRKLSTSALSKTADTLEQEGPTTRIETLPPTLIELTDPDCPQMSYDASQKPGNGVVEIKLQRLQEIHSEGLTEERAVQLSLINNPELFAYYENLEIGYAGLLEAGLRQNPVVSASARIPNETGKQINREFDTAISFSDNFLIPLRQRAAEAEIRVIESEIRQRVLDLVMEVHIDWLEVKSLEIQAGHEFKRGELKELAAGLAHAQRKAGNISPLMARNRELEYEMAKEKLKGLKADWEKAKEKLNRSLGLFGDEACWRVIGELDWKSDSELPPLRIMEMAAIENRPDLEVVRREIEAIAREADLKQWWTYSNLKVGTSSEQDTDGAIVSGPSIELELPVFNNGQGERKKYYALLEQAQKKLLAKAVQASSEVREFSKTLSIYQSQLEDLENKILPDRAQQIVDGQAHYNVMTLGVYELFDLKDAESQASIEHVQALKHYKKAKIALLHAVGGSFAVLGERL